MKARKSILLAIVALLSFQSVSAQEIDALGTFTPYSLFGVGDLHGSNSAITQGLGGIGMGVRNPAYINFKNIASLTERDTLSLMFDLGGYSKNMYLKDQNTKSAYNAANINNFVFSFPIYDKHAMVVGIMPYSNMGYKFSTDETDNVLISKYGNIQYFKYGTGSINQAFVGGAVKINKYLSAGLKGIYYFGSQTNHSDVYFSSGAMRTIESGWKYSPHGFSFEAAVQGTYKPAEDYTLTVGAVYRMKNKMHGSTTRYSYAYNSEIRDTISYNKVASSIYIPATISAGIALKKGDKWMAGIDYERQDWSKAELNNTVGVGYKAQTAQSIRTGI